MAKKGKKRRGRRVDALAARMNGALDKAPVVTDSCRIVLAKKAWTMAKTIKTDHRKHPADKLAYGYLRQAAGCLYLSDRFDRDPDCADLQYDDVFVSSDA